MDLSISEYMNSNNISDEQQLAIDNLIISYSEKIKNEENVSHMGFQEDMYNILPQFRNNGEAIEHLLKVFHKNGFCQEVFIVLYGDMPENRYYLKNKELK